MNALDNYLIFGLPKVDGWLEPYSAEFIALLSGIQLDAGFDGSIGEIGVHHGKLLILMLLASGRRDQSFAIDVFDKQHLNVDKSGHGDKVALLRNIARWAPGFPPVAIIEQSSLDVRPGDILAVGGEPRMMSIDGGHTEECVLNDLRLCERVLSSKGIAVLDDCFNQSWPGVLTGLAKYLLDPNTKLRPFAISPNKVYLSLPGNKELYWEKLRSFRKFKPDTRQKMFGEDIEIYGAAQSEGTLSRIKELLKQSSIGPYLMAAKAHFAQPPCLKPKNPAPEGVHSCGQSSAEDPMFEGHARRAIGAKFLSTK